MQESGCVMKQSDDSQPASVVATPQQAGEARPPREAWGWVERCVWTERMLTRLTPGESADRVWFARRGLLSLAAAHEWTRTIVKLRTH